MRKILVALMIVAFAVTAFADMKISGYYTAGGQYQSNLNDTDFTNNDDVEMYYEHEFKLWVNADTDKDTFFKSKLEIVDSSWNNSAASYGTETTHFQVERAWMGHNFGVAKLEVGIMNGGGWGYSFGNNVEGYYRVKATVPAGPGNLIFIVQKDYENSQVSAAKDAEKDDKDSYVVAYSGKFGGLTVAPLIQYIADGSVDKTDGDVDNTTMVYDLAVGGDFGAVGVETEVKYYDVNKEVGNDQKYWGAMANVFGKVSGAKVGFVTAYASSDDKDGTFNMADDFDDDFPFVLGDEGYWNGAGDITGAWTNSLYASYDVNEKLNLNGAATYLMSNYESGALEDATAYELDLGADYAITKELSYSVDFGYAQVDLDKGSDYDAAVVLKHALTLSF